MERKIGEIFKYNGEWYQCLKSASYYECAFIDKNCDNIRNLRGYCIAPCRRDRTDAHFKKLEKVGEPYDDCGTILQRFKIYINVTNADTKGLELHIYSNDTIGIEIKQNKEDMEEKNLNLKPFDLQKAKEGKPVCTRDGRKARIICFDAKRKDEKSIIALVPSKDYPGFEDLIAYPNNGNYHGGHENDGDLMMLLEKKEGWVNVYYDNDTSSNRGCRFIYDTKEQAIKSAGKEYITTIKIEWEE